MPTPAARIEGGARCYNHAPMTDYHSLCAFWAGIWEVPVFLQAWKNDASGFLRQDAPKLLLIIVLAFVFIRILRSATRRVAALDKRMPPGVRAQQIRTLASVVTSVGVFVIMLWALMETFAIFHLDVRPLLASAGVAGLAIGFGAQTMVHDFLNGFFILLENQYDIGDVIRVAGVKGTVETMSLRRTILRDEDGTVHVVPNSEIKIVSNTTRDWSQFALRVAVAYSEPSDKIIALLRQVSEDVRHDPAFSEDIVSDIQIPGIDRVGQGEAEYLMLIKTRPNKQYGVSRELRRRIKENFQKNNIQTAGPGRVYVVDQTTGA
jgi:moderate conductance mechanosensitive channel